jgi:SAM-dependent methyltransferase
MNISMKSYWNERYQGGRIWGDIQCPSAMLAKEHFKRHNVQSVLVPGCGYGRNSLYFAQQGFEVVAFDISDLAIEHAVEQAKIHSVENLQYIVGDLFNPLFLGRKQFDGIYLSNVIHLFLKNERDALLDIVTSLLKPKGILTFSCISIYDTNNYGIGDEIEPNTFMKHEGKPLHFFNDEEIPAILGPRYRILEQRLHIQTESDPNGEVEDLHLWFVAAEKR